MQCFYHHQNHAVALCKNCSKALCVECAADEGHGAACKNRCEAEVKSLWQIIERSKGLYKKTAWVYLRGAMLYGLMGLLFTLFPYFFPDTSSDLRYLFLGMGGLLFFGTILSLINAFRVQK